MKKAGINQIETRDELKPPMLLAFAQLLFAAILLYAIRNPIPMEDPRESTSLQTEQPVIATNAPMVNMAVAAPAHSASADLPM